MRREGVTDLRDLEGMRVYISGPMEGLPDMNKDAFDAATEAVLGAGAREVFNPCWIAEHAETREEALAYDIHRLASMCMNGNAVLLQLPGWEESRGAVLERSVGTACGANLAEWDTPQDA